MAEESIYNAQFLTFNVLRGQMPKRVLRIYFRNTCSKF